MKWSEKLKISELKDKYSKQRIITIADALDPVDSELVYSSLNDVTEGNIWYQALRGNPHYINKSDVSNTHDFHYRFDKFPLSNITIKKLLGVTADSKRADFRAVMKYGDSPEKELPSFHPLSKLGSFLNSDECYSLFTEITGHKFTKNSTVSFLSRYMAGDYLSTHDDSDPKNERVLTFILSLNKTWEHHWGGQTLIFNKKNTDSVTDCIIPSYNTLTIFDVPLLHCVLPVSNFSQAPRYAISGWIHKSPRI
ncbi:2OG-Fe(II) oxygenase [Neptunomonas qingdaonensis]|uniref:2OG-Fe(II) oxygenase superfamily protein n=1 Tax=Neptunomonas qingdaonensis TaxID=1045558 RepID=A0A1I2TMS5_9GAMM|nr:2OG-Fe(II) oxygenase family protein [Neptunomonas qingdaonensis]SFG66212.1 2OG-Fe(II) oxygenase superfamily protein [Neptunomonas qingdaonensis]